MKNLKQIIYVGWEESERGWGTRPDGCSLHLTLNDFKAFEQAYWKRMPKQVPDEYSRPADSPIIVGASPNLYRKIRASKNGVRYYESELVELRDKKKLVYGSERSGWMPLER